MSKFLFVVPRFHTNLFFATKALVQAGHQVKVFAAKREPTEDYSFVTPQVVGRDSSPRDLRHDLKAFAPDLVILRTARPLSRWVEGAGRFGRLPMLRYDQKAMSELPAFRDVLERAVQGLPQWRVTPKPARHGVASIDPRAHYLPWPVARDPEVPVRQRQPDAPLAVLCVGKLMQQRKGQHKLIAAMAAGLAEGRMTLTLVGSTLGSVRDADPDHLDSLRRAAAASQGRITLKENLDFGDMGSVYGQHDVCVLPAAREQLGTAPIEAMAYGCVPVIGGRCGSAGYLTDGVDGHVVSMDHPEVLTAVLDRLAKDPAQLSQMSAAARHTAETELGPARFVQRMEQLVARPKG
ncbi:glycosyltransferase family 4 protein [Pseudoruegeria sp. SK021]|uniref:glycosyltransferase family 4 protein n=1 Tax=Pseudoruegeria sp. SK021 TaxID=1933035 RepID=UPI000A222059|nr:glycosyltransferase family 4 protein [Pseudoruegeria sp. SK021]OSP54270.1 hypothetical protein BV911_13510 [Pseudoruegeria sp. SK021]